MKRKDKTPIVYAFIDSQNLNLGIRSQGWVLDFKKFRLYLKNKYHVEKAYLFIGMVPGNEQLYTHLSEMGYSLVFKPTVKYKVDDKYTYKGNVDAELVLYASARCFKEYDKAIIVSGDGDFRCLADYLIEKGKMMRLLCPNRRYSSLLGRYRDYISVIGNNRKTLKV